MHVCIKCWASKLRIRLGRRARTSPLFSTLNTHRPPLHRVSRRVYRARDRRHRIPLRGPNLPITLLHQLTPVPARLPALVRPHGTNTYRVGCAASHGHRSPASREVTGYGMDRPRLLEQGRACIQAGDYTTAAKHLKAVARTCPTCKNGKPDRCCPCKDLLRAFGKDRLKDELRAACRCDAQSNQRCIDAHHLDALSSLVFIGLRTNQLKASLNYAQKMILISPRDTKVFICPSRPKLASGLPRLRDRATGLSTSRTGASSR